MKILSWDVGIKNLAYCLLDDKDTQSFTILDWGMINLVDDRDVCDFKLRNCPDCFVVKGHSVVEKNLIDAWRKGYMVVRVL